MHPVNGASFDSWILNTNGKDHHGDAFKADGGSSSCGGCHWDYWRSPTAFGDIRPSRGWCFQCHAGANGGSAGFVDPTK